MRVRCVFRLWYDDNMHYFCNNTNTMYGNNIKYTVLLKCVFRLFSVFIQCVFRLLSEYYKSVYNRL